MFLNKESLDSQILIIIKTIIKQREGSIILKEKNMEKHKRKQLGQC